MKLNSQNKVIRVVTSKTFFAFLCLALIFLTIFLVSTYGRVKGLATKTYYTIVWDENTRVLARSTSSEVNEVLAQNGIKVYPEDVITTDLILDPVTDGGAGQKITIKRAPVYHVEVDGGTRDIRSWGKTISDVLSGNIPLSPRDIVEPVLDSNAIPGYIKITRINILELDETVTVAFGTTYQEDYYLPLGTEKVITAGVNGSKINNLRITYRNGIEVSRVILGSTITLKPQSKVVKKGVMPSNSRDFNRAYWDMMVGAGQKYGVSPVDLFEVAECESHVNPDSQGKYYGMYQYSDGFWQSAFYDAGFAGYNWNSAIAQIYSTAKYVAAHGWGKWASCAP